MNFDRLAPENQNGNPIPLGLPFWFGKKAQSPKSNACLAYQTLDLGLSTWDWTWFLRNQLPVIRRCRGNFLVTLDPVNDQLAYLFA